MCRSHLRRFWSLPSSARRSHLLGVLSLVARGVVSLEQVKTEVVFVISPHRMDVISLVLRAVHLDQKGGRLDAIIVQAAALNVSGPSEKGRVFGLLSRQFHPPIRHRLRHVRGV